MRDLLAIALLLSTPIACSPPTQQNPDVAMPPECEVISDILKESVEDGTLNADEARDIYGRCRYVEF